MQEKYDRIGLQYNDTRRADPYLFDRMLHLLSPKKEGTYLDIGCGTGNYTKEFDARGYRFIGIDPSKKMLDKAKSTPNSVTWRLGKAETLDAPPASIDGCLAVLTIHHWEQLQKGFTALEKVLKPNGKLVIFTSTPLQMKGYWLHHYFPKMMRDSISQMPSLANIKTALQQSGLRIEERENYTVRNDLKDCFLYIGKQNPTLYLDPMIRQGISSFSALSNKDEVNKGLEDLKNDIETGKIEQIIANYKNNDGDYLFLVIGKEKKQQ